MDATRARGGGAHVPLLQLPVGQVAHIVRGLGPKQNKKNKKNKKKGEKKKRMKRMGETRQRRSGARKTCKSKRDKEKKGTNKQLNNSNLY